MWVYIKGFAIVVICAFLYVFTVDNGQYLDWQARYKDIANDSADAAALYYDIEAFSNGIKIFNKEEGNKAALAIIKAGLSMDDSLKGNQSVYLKDVHTYYVYYFDGDGTFTAYNENTLLETKKIEFPYKFKEPLNDYETTIKEPIVIVTIDAGNFKFRGLLPDRKMIRTSAYEYVEY